MAYSFAVIGQTVEGNKRQYFLSMTCDANSGSIQTPLSVIDAYAVTPSSAATTAPKFKANLNSGATAANGFLFGSSCTNGDSYFVVVWGH